MLDRGIQVGALYPRPREAPFQEVDQHVPNRLQVIPSAVRTAFVYVQTGIAKSSNKAFPVFHLVHMRFGLWVHVPCSHSQINSVDLVEFLPQSHDEILRLDVPVQVPLVMQVLDIRDDLVCDHQDSLQGESSVADLKIILQVVAEKVSDHEVKILFLAVPFDIRNPDAALELREDGALVGQEFVLGGCWLALDCHLVLGLGIPPHIHRGVGPLEYLLAQHVSPCHSDFNRTHVIYNKYSVLFNFTRKDSHLLTLSPRNWHKDNIKSESTQGRGYVLFQTDPYFPLWRTLSL